MFLVVILIMVTMVMVMVVFMVIIVMLEIFDLERNKAEKYRKEQKLIGTRRRYLTAIYGFHLIYSSFGISFWK